MDKPLTHGYCILKLNEENKEIIEHYDKKIRESAASTKCVVIQNNTSLEDSFDKYTIKHIYDSKGTIIPLKNEGYRIFEIIFDERKSINKFIGAVMVIPINENISFGEVSELYIQNEEINNLYDRVWPIGEN